MKKLLLAIAGAALLTGCGSTPIQDVNTAEGVLIPSVDTSMKVWATYVASTGASQQEINTVSNAYVTYYNAQMIVKATMEQVVASGSTNTADIITADTSLLNAATNVVNLINQYAK